MTKLPSLAVGFPCARQIRSQFVIDAMAFVSDNRYHMPTPKFDATAGRIDLSRSNLFEWAKNGAGVAPTHKVTAHYQVDTDVTFLQGLHDMTQIVLEDFQMGWDIVMGPTVADNYRSMTWGFDEKPQSYGPNKVMHGAFGFVAFSPNILAGLKPLDYITNVDHQRLPLYCLSTTQTEDNSFCDNAREQGFKVCCDFRLHVGHNKERILAPCLADQYDELAKRFPKVMWIVQDIRLVDEKPKEAVAA